MSVRVIKPASALRKVAPTLLDRAIAWAFPSWGLRRLQDRVRYSAVKRFHETLEDQRDRFRKRHHMRGPNEVTRSSLEHSRAQARVLYREDPFVRGTIRALVANLVSMGIYPIPTVGNPRAGGSNESWNDRTMQAFARWSRGVDHQGKVPFGTMQKRMVRESYVAGEYLLHMATPHVDREVPLALELIASERIANIESSPFTPSGNKVIQGVEFDGNGTRVAYHVYTEHPSDSWVSPEVVRLPAEDCIHYYQPEEEGQVRGISRLRPIADTADRAGQWRDFVMAREQVSTAFAVMITQNTPGISTLADVDQDDEDDDGNLVSRLQGGLLFWGRPGEQIQGVQNQTRAAEVDKMMAMWLREFARGLDCSYELVSRDLSKVTYLSARQGENEDRRVWEPEQQELIDCVLWWIYQRWLSTAIRASVVGKPANAPMERFQSVDFIRPGRDWIDPEKDIEAAVLGIKAGIVSAIEVVARRGKNWKKIQDDNALFMDGLRDKGLPLAEYEEAKEDAKGKEEEEDEDEENGGAETVESDGDDEDADDEDRIGRNRLNGHAVAGADA